MISPPPSRSPIISSEIFKKLGITDNPAIDSNWQEFFSDVYFGIKYTQTSGTTAQRPIKDLFPGRFYFDTSLGANGKPIWINKNGTGWVTADGVAA